MKSRKGIGKGDSDPSEIGIRRLTLTPHSLGTALVKIFGGSIGAIAVTVSVKYVEKQRGDSPCTQFRQREQLSMKRSIPRIEQAVEERGYTSRELRHRTGKNVESTRICFEQGAH